ncbi:MAG: tetratricopeptide repeat protein, partial [Pseudobdellovibrionaceae bacterium]
MNDIVNELKDIDVQIKRGNFTSASSMLRKLYRRLSTSGEMKAHINELCQLAWRINRPQWILRWLKPSISDKDLSLTRSVPPDLILIYAAALIDIGIFHQAEKLLDLDSVKNIPQANQYRAMAHIRRWNYDLAIPCLRAYMDSLPQEHYSRRVAQVNLAESYICENKLDEAENVLVDLNHYIKESQNRLFSNTTKKLWLRFFIEKKNWQSAKSIIEETSSFLSHQKSFERTFMKKWHIILKMYEKGLDEALKAEFDDIRREAVHSLHWETLRDIDWQICKWNPDPEILNRLWYGTDYPHYRKQIEERFHFQPSQELVFNLKLLNPFQV